MYQRLSTPLVMAGLIVVALLALTLATAPGAGASAPSPHGSPAPTSPRVFGTSRAALDNLAVADIASDGRLTAAGSPITTGDSIDTAIAMSAEGFAFVAGSADQRERTYRVAADGSLSELPGSPTALPGVPAAVAVSLDGAHVFFTMVDPVNAVSLVASYSVAPDGALIASPGSPFPGPGGPRGLALAPDGRHLYVGSSFGELTTYGVALDGTLTAVDTIPGLSSLGDLAITPDGRRLYVAAMGDQAVMGWSVAGDGSLTALPGSPYTGLVTPTSLAMSPDGLDLYVLSQPGLSGFSIAADGSLTDLGFRRGGAAQMQNIAVAPGGRFVYGRGFTGTFGYARGSSGQLTALPGSPFAIGAGATSSFHGVAVSPDLGPQAGFAADASGSSVAFDATGSSDPDGTVARYDWDFGDGSHLSDGGPTPSHVYAQPGSYPVTLTLTDDLGCSATDVYTGQTASCAQTSGATLTRTVVVNTGPVITAPTTSRTDISPDGWSNTAVTVTFTCTPAPGTYLVTPCPPPVTFRHQLHGRTLTRSVTDSQGHTSTASVLVRIDRYQPFVTVHGVRNGSTYAHQRPVTCTGLDHFTGRVPCHVHTHLAHGPDGSLVIRYRAAASDAAGNTTVRHGRYFLEG